MHRGKLILVSVFIVLAAGVLFFYAYNMNHRKNSEVSDLINYFKDVLMLKVETEETNGTPFEFYNDADRYPSAVKVFADVKYNVNISKNRGEIILEYTQKIYTNEKRMPIHSAINCPSIWYIEKMNDKWEIVKFAEPDYQYGMTDDEYTEAREILIEKGYY